MKELNKWVEDKYMKLYKKYITSRSIFIILNLISLVLVASMVILGIFAIKKNPFENTKPYYVAVLVLTGAVGFFTSIISFFSINKNANKCREQYDLVKEEYSKYKANEGKYDDKNKDSILIDSIYKITEE